MKKGVYCVLLAIIIFAAFLRLYRLGEIPVGLHRDEAFLGYNAYSILKTGRDITGAWYPIHLRSFLYSPAGYSYASIPFIAMLDLSAFSVRLASAFSGTLTIFVTFLLLLTLFRDDKYRHILALAGSFLLAISPWHINLSRTATENSLATLLITSGTLLFLLARKKYAYLLTSYCLFFISLITYQAPRAFLPLFIPFLIVLFRKNRSIRLTSIAVILYVALILLPTTVILRSPKLSLRLSTVSLFATPQTQLVLEEQIREDGTAAINPLLARIFHNKMIGYGEEFLRIYFQHFSFDFLFTDNGLPSRYRVPGSGLLYLIELPLIIYGAFCLARKKSPAMRLIFAWVLLAPVGSSLAFDDVPNLQRTMLIFPAVTSLSAYGLISLLSMKSKYRFYLILSMLTFIFAYQFTSYLHDYYVHQIVHRPWFRQEGYKELVEKVNALLPNYEKAIITNSESGSAILFLFYSKYDPGIFINETHTENDIAFDRINFSHFEFTTADCPLTEIITVDEVTGKKTVTYTGKPNILYVNSGRCETPKTKATLLGEIRRHDQSPVFQILTSE